MVKILFRVDARQTPFLVLGRKTLDGVWSLSIALRRVISGVAWVGEPDTGVSAIMAWR
jgi:hypothetical protein